MPGEPKWVQPSRDTDLTRKNQAEVTSCGHSSGIVERKSTALRPISLTTLMTSNVAPRAWAGVKNCLQSA
jgi:hypothetical protein